LFLALFAVNRESFALTLQVPKLLGGFKKELAPNEYICH
jgi:hypothetical protein